MRSIVLAIALVLGFAALVLADSASVPALVGDTATAAPPVVAAPIATVTNPAEHPIQAWDEARAAKKSGWAMLVFFCLVALTKALAYGRDKLQGLPLIGWAAKRLSVGKTAMIVAGIGAVGCAGYDVLIGGGSPTAALFAAGAALGGVMHSTTKGA